MKTQPWPNYRPDYNLSARVRICCLGRMFAPPSRQRSEMKFLRWAGSKVQLVDTLAHCWHAARVLTGADRYVEAFAGSAALFFELRPAKALLIDVNMRLQECMGAVRSDPETVHAHLKLMRGDEDTYYKIRSMDPSKFSLTKRAAQFIYLNRFCFNGLYRTNRSGAFNVPFGGLRNGRIPTLEELKLASNTLQSAELLCGDFQELLASRIRKKDFIYLDPPYAMRNVNLDNQYGPDVFGLRDIERLSDLAQLIDRKGAKFVISYADCPEAQQLANCWNYQRVSVQRTIAANAEHRAKASELLITNI